MHFMCDLVSDVLSTYIAYVISACYRISFTLIDVGWIFISVRSPPFEKEENDFEVCLHQPCLVNKWNGPDRIEHPIGSSIIDFRVKNNGSLPTRMRSLFSRNLNSWRTFDSNTVPVAFSEARFQVKKSACFWRHGRYQE